jgi:hypothetical protein
MKVEINCSPLNSNGLLAAALNKEHVDKRTPCSDGTLSDEGVVLSLNESEIYV